MLTEETTMMQIASYNNSSEASRPTVRLKRLEDDEAMSHYIPSKSGTFIVSVEEKQPTPKPNSDWNPVYEDISDEDNAPSDMVTCLPNIEMQPKAILNEDIVVQKTGEKRRHSDPVNLNMSKKPRRRKRRWSFNSNADVNEPLRKRYNNRMMIAKEYNKYKSFILVGDSPVHETGYDTEPDIESLVKKEYCYDDEQSEERFADEAPTMNYFAGDEQTRKRLVDGEPTNNNGLDDEHTKERLESSTNKVSDKKTEKRLGDRASANDASGDKQTEERLVDGEPTSNKASDEQTEKRLGDGASANNASGDKQIEERLVDGDPTSNKASDVQSDRASTDDASGEEQTEKRLVDREATSNMVSDEQTDKRLGDRALTDGASAVVIDIEDEDTIDAPTNFGAPKEEIKNEKVDGYKSSYKQKLETTFDKMFSSGNFSDYKSSFKKDESEAYCGKVKTDEAEGYKKCDVSVKIKKEHERDNKMVNKTVEIASKDMSIDDENDVVILETIKHPTNVKNKPINFNIRNSNSQGASARRNAPLIIITEAPCATVTDDLEPNDICQQEVNKRDKERAREKETDVNNKEKVREKETDVNNVHPIKDKVQSSKTNPSKTERKSKFSECSENKNDIPKDIKKTSMKRKVRNSRRSFRHSSIEMFQVSKEPHVPWSYADKKLHASQDKSLTNHQSNLEKVIITDPEDDAPSPGSLTIDLDDTNKNTDVEDNSILKEKIDVETPKVVSHEVNDSQNSKVFNTSVVSKKTTKPGTVDNSQSEDLDSVGEACEEEANKITKTSKRTHTGDSKVMKEMVQQHLMSDMEEKDRRLAKEFPRYNWLEEKIRNRSLAPNKYSEEPPTKKTKPSPPEEKAQQETPQEDPVSIQARKPVIVTMKSTDISPLLEHLTTTGDLEVTLSTPPAASSTASVDSGVSVRTQSESEQCDTPLVSVQAVIAPKPPQPLMSPIELQSQQHQELPPAPPLPPPPPLQPQPQLPFPQSPTMKSLFGQEQLPPTSQPVLYGPRRDWETDPSVRKVGDNAENSSDRASVVVPPLPERVMYSDRIATMARHAATSFDTGLVGPAAMLEDAHRNHRRFQRPPDPTTNNMLQQAQKAALLQAPQIPQQSSNEANYQQVGSHTAATLPDSSLRSQVIKPSAQYATNFHPPYAPPPQLGRALLPPFGYPGPHTGEVPAPQTSQINNNMAQLAGPTQHSTTRIPPQKAANSPPVPADPITEHNINSDHFKSSPINQYRYLQLYREHILNNLHAVDLRLNETGRAIQAVGSRAPLMVPPTMNMETQLSNKTQDHSTDNRQRRNRRNRTVHAAQRQGTENPNDRSHMHMSALHMHMNHRVPEQRRQGIDQNQENSLTHLQATMPPSHLIHPPDLQRPVHSSTAAMHHREEPLQTSHMIPHHRSSQMAPVLTQPPPPSVQLPQQSPTSSHRTLPETNPIHQLTASRANVPVASISKVVPHLSPSSHSSQIPPPMIPNPHLSPSPHSSHTSSRIPPPMIPNPHLSPGIIRSPHSPVDDVRNVLNFSEGAYSSHSIPPPPPLQRAPPRRTETIANPSTSREAPIDLSVSKQKETLDQQEMRSEAHPQETNQYAGVSTLKAMMPQTNNPRIPLQTFQHETRSEAHPQEANQHAIVSTLNAMMPQTNNPRIPLQSFQQETRSEAQPREANQRAVVSALNPMMLQTNNPRIPLQTFQQETRSEAHPREANQRAVVSALNPLMPQRNNPRIPSQMLPSTSTSSRPVPVHSSQMVQPGTSSQFPPDHIRRQVCQTVNNETPQTRPQVTAADARPMQNQMQAIAARNPPVEQVLQNDARQVQLHGRVTYPVGPMPRFTEADQHFLRCVACGHPARFMCSACHLASYCTSKCQSRHWAIHQPQCCLEQERIMFLASRC